MSADTAAFEVRQEDDAIPGRRLAKIAAFAVSVGLIGVASLGRAARDEHPHGIRGHLPEGASPRPAGTSIAHIEQTPLFGVAERHRSSVVGMARRALSLPLA